VASFWKEVIAETLGSIPVFAAGLWLSHRKLRSHLEKVTRHQTGQIETLTVDQTAVLAGLTEAQTAELLEHHRPEA
jgi:hypothetical protein